MDYKNIYDLAQLNNLKEGAKATEAKKIDAQIKVVQELMDNEQIAFGKVVEGRKLEKLELFVEKFGQYDIFKTDLEVVKQLIVEVKAQGTAEGTEEGETPSEGITDETPGEGTEETTEAPGESEEGKESKEGGEKELTEEEKIGKAWGETMQALMDADRLHTMDPEVEIIHEIEKESFESGKITKAGLITALEEKGLEWIGAILMKVFNGTEPAEAVKEDTKAAPAAPAAPGSIKALIAKRSKKGMTRVSAAIAQRKGLFGHTAKMSVREAIISRRVKK